MYMHLYMYKYAYIRSSVGIEKDLLTVDRKLTSLFNSFSMKYLNLLFEFKFLFSFSFFFFLPSKKSAVS